MQRRRECYADGSRARIPTVAAKEEIPLDVSSENLRCLAVLGRRDEPTDAVEDYCQYLRRALTAQGISLELKQLLWAQIGWRKALREFRKSMVEKNTDWCLLQYTALSWSRRGFSIRVLQVIRALKRCGTRCALVFHDAEPYFGIRVVDRLRRAIQIWTMRQAVRLVDLAIFTIPPEIVSWVPDESKNAVFIPVGANLPAPDTVWKQAMGCNKNGPAVAVFSLSDGDVRAGEVKLIAGAVRYASERIGKLQIVVFGRNSSAGAKELKERLAGTPVEINALGLLTPGQVVQTLATCDVMLFARGPLSTRRSSALAGIACGLPVLGKIGWETSAPITEAGVVLLPGDPKEDYGPALLRVLSDESYRASLAERSKRAYERYFSWNVIATQYARVLREN